MSRSRSGERIAAVADETRRATRRRAFLGGAIVSRDGALSLGCTVRDFSPGGARIALPRATVVPARFFLLISRRPLAWDARIVWRNASQAGLAFAGERPLSPDMDEELLFLWRLYRELGLRATNPFDY